MISQKEKKFKIANSHNPTIMSFVPLRPFDDRQLLTALAQEQGVTTENIRVLQDVGSIMKTMLLNGGALTTYGINLTPHYPALCAALDEDDRQILDTTGYVVTHLKNIEEPLQAEGITPHHTIHIISPKFIHNITVEPLNAGFFIEFTKQIQNTKLPYRRGRERPMINSSLKDSILLTKAFREFLLRCIACTGKTTVTAAHPIPLASYAQSILYGMTHGYHYN